MSKNMLIDSAHTEEVRIAVIDGDRLEKFDFEATSKAQVKGNIYLAKIIRVEPSLQAAFVNYGGNRHGFLSFSEIHHSYFQIPVGDQNEMESYIQNAIAARYGTNEDMSEIDPRELSNIRYQFYRRYKIQEVIKKRQIMLVQVTKEERGNKGAALTTYISLAGRYCVLMPNTTKGSGVSRKIVNHADRAKLKKIVSSLNIENGSTVIRTAGIGHTKAEITKDFEYLTRLWDEIRETTLQSTAPCLIHEEANVIKRAIRDMYSRDMESVFVEGEAGYKIAKNYVKKLMPSHAKKVKLYEDKSVPLFAKFKINDQINQIYSTRVSLPSGGYLIINNTEALVAIDVNSGKSTHERNVAGTALKTNLEAAAEIARQCRLRDLGGLIVIDFIDMEDRRDNAKVERCLKHALRDDKAKVQVGNISAFGLLELSRQRLRASIADANMVICPHCQGTGLMWSEESNALQILRRIEELCSHGNCREVRVTVAPSVAVYIFNHKRSFLNAIEVRNDVKVILNTDNNAGVNSCVIEQIARVTRPDANGADDGADEDHDDEIPVTPEPPAVRSKKNRRKAQKAKSAPTKSATDSNAATENNAAHVTTSNPTDSGNISYQREDEETSDTQISSEDNETLSADNSTKNGRKPRPKAKRRRPDKRKQAAVQNSEQSAAIPQVFPKKVPQLKEGSVDVSLSLQPEIEATVTQLIQQTANEEYWTVDPTMRELPKKKKGWWNRLLQKTEEK